MGNLCGRQSDDPFSQPGRTLGSAPAPSSGISHMPQNVSAAHGRTLGGPSNGEDARRAAARAAEDRANTHRPTGKLGKDLATQRQQNRTNTLEQASRQERRHRDADAGAAVRNWE